MIGWIIFGLIAVIIAFLLVEPLDAFGHYPWQIIGQILVILGAIASVYFAPMVCGTWMTVGILGPIIIAIAVPGITFAFFMATSDNGSFIWLSVIWVCIMSIANYFNPMPFLN